MNISQFDAQVRYCLDDFIDDQSKVLAVTGADLPSQTKVVEHVDGRLCRVYPRRLHDAVGERQATRPFLEKYGDEEGASHFVRFSLVVEFLSRFRSELAQSGLAEQEGTMAIREEFVNYLLNLDVAEDTKAIPRDALLQFLDEWGCRWM